MTLDQALQHALERHRAGALSEAEAIYRRILASQPDHPDALHLLSEIALRTGHLAAGEELIARAVALQPRVPQFQVMRGSILMGLNRREEAVLAFQRALDLDPNCAAAHQLLPGLLGRLGQPEAAIAALRAAVRALPNEAGLWNDLSVALADYRPADGNAPDQAAEDARLDEAIAAGRRAVALQPDRAVMHYNLGNALARRRLEVKAVESFRRALALQPDHARAASNLGFMLLGLGRVREAVDTCERAVALLPESREPNEHLGVALFWAGEYERAIAQFRRLLGLFPSLPGPRRALGLALLLLGRYEEGWREYEARLELLPPRSFAAPRWNGEPRPGGAIYLHCEQGFGDSIHFIRYALRVRARSGADRVIVECQPELARLFRENGGWEADIVARGGDDASLPPFDAHLTLTSLPLVLELFQPLPTAAPYLRADPALRAAWRERLGPASGLRVGLAWAGSANHQSDLTRSIAAERLLPLLSTPGVSFYSLQLGRAAGAAQPLAEAGLIDLTAHLGDFADTAALLGELDLVISVDTAVVHLAGAMDRPVWTLLAFVPDWRWGLEREDTPWYPSMRLFRQSTLGDWEPVLERVAAELHALVESKD